MVAVFVEKFDYFFYSWVEGDVVLVDFWLGGHCLVCVVGGAAVIGISLLAAVIRLWRCMLVVVRGCMGGLGRVLLLCYGLLVCSGLWYLLL